MGGKAFNSRGLSTSRMPPEVYYQVLGEVQTKLRTVYAQAETPTEAPEKTDHGDIDVLVVPHESRLAPTGSELAILLGAKDQFRTPNSTTIHLALPWPKDKTEDAGDAANVAEGSYIIHCSAIKEAESRYIQVDVNVSPTGSQLRFTLFAHSHGDLGVILGAMVRRFGFIITPSGLYLQIKALASWNKHRSRVLITDDPEQVLRYFGLDAQRYQSMFGCWNEVFAFAATCRFHDPRYGEDLDNVDDATTKFPVKHHDRSKSKQRPMLAYWFEEYLPKHRDGQVGSASQMNRDEVADDAKAFFGEEFAREYDERKEKGLEILEKAQLWSDVRKILPCQGGDLTVAMTGLKYEIEQVHGDDETKGRGRGEMTEVQKTYSERRYDDVQNWVKENWMLVKKRQDERNREKSTMKLLEHLAKQETTAGHEPE